MMEVMSTEEMVSLLEPGSSPARKKQSSQDSGAKKPKEQSQTEPEATEEDFNPVAAAIKRSNAKLVLEDSSDNDEGLEQEPTSKSNPSDSRNASSSKDVDKSSDSENDDEVVTASSKKKKRAILDDSDSDRSDVPQSKKSDSEASADNVAASSRKKKRAVLDDSDSDGGDVPQSKKSDSEGSAENSSDGEEMSSNKPKKKLAKKRRGAFANSSDDSSDEESTKKTTAKSKINDSSSDSEGPLDTSVHHRVHTSSEEEGKSRNLSSAESEDDLAKIKGSFQAKSGKGRAAAGGKEVKKRKEKQQSRKSRDNAMREIRSESNRMLRESAVGLPYHAPKQRTLDEFLNRHKAASVLPTICKDFKTIHVREEVELEKAEQLLKKCEQETEEFFAAAPEEDEDTDDEDYVPMETDTVEQSAEVTEGEPTSSKAVNDSGIATSSAVESDESASSEAVIEPSNEQQPATPPNEPAVEKPPAEEESESLRLFLEPDTEKLVLSDDDDEDEVKSAESEVVQSSQSAQPATELTPGGIKAKLDASAKLANLASLGDDILNLTPKLGKQPAAGGDELIVFEEAPSSGGNKGIDLLKDRFVKHVRCDKKRDEAKKAAEGTTLTIVSKEKDSATGQETLKTETLNYVPSQGTPSAKHKVDFDKVRQAKKTERIGAQVLALKATLKEKIAEKKRQERQKNDEMKKMDNEEGETDDEEDKEQEAEDSEDEEILDDEDITDEEDEDDSEEEEEMEDTAATKERRRIKASCSFLNDEAEDDDDNDDDEENEDEDELILTKNDRDDIGAVVSAVLGEDEDALPAEEPRPQDMEAAVADEDADSPFSSLLDPRWTPYSQQTQQRLKAASAAEEGGSKPSAKKKLGFDNLFDVSDPQVDDMDDVVGLLSGQFATQAGAERTDEDEADFGRAGMSQTQDTVLNSQQPFGTPDTQALTSKPTLTGTPDTQPLTTSNNTAVGGTPDTQPLTGSNSAAVGATPDTQPLLTHQPTPDTLPLTADAATESTSKPLDEVEDRQQPGFMEDDCGFLMLSSDDDDEEAAVKKKVLTKKKVKKLVLSDDSESEGEDEVKRAAVGSDQEEDENDKEDKGDDKIVMYDSEENEITMAEYKKKFKGFKNKKGKMRGVFVDEEAALSGSDEELARYSDDEDERGLDGFEQEAGDADDLDDDEVRDELERIHHREVLNQDQREIKYIQEVMLDDGDLHSDNARTRKFRWNNLDDDIELERRPSDDEAENEDAETLQAEQEKRRLERMEREKWLKESEETTDVAKDKDDEDDSQFFSMAQKAMKKLDSKTTTITKPTKKPSVVSPSQSRLFPLRPMTSNQKGSFLGREAATLERLAEMTKGVDNQRTGTGAKKSTKNFVFTTVSPTKGQGDDDEGKSSTNAKRKKTTPAGNPAAAKKAKVARSIDENSCDTIFGKLSWS